MTTAAQFSSHRHLAIAEADRLATSATGRRTRSGAPRHRPEEERQVDMGTARKCLYMLEQVPVVATCYRLLTQALFSNGISVVQADKVLNPGPSYSMVLDRYYEQFAKDALRAIVTLGVVPVRIVEERLEDEVRDPGSDKAGGKADKADRGTGRRSDRLQLPVETTDEMRRRVLRYPRVVHGDYTLTVWYDTDSERLRYNLYRPTLDGVSEARAARMPHTQVHGYHDPDVMVFDGFGHDPTHAGQVRSMCSQLLGWWDDLHQLGLQTRQMDRNNAVPFYFLQSPDHFSDQAASLLAANNGSTAIDGLQATVQVNGEVRHLTREQMQFGQQQHREWTRAVEQLGEDAEDSRRAAAAGGGVPVDTSWVPVPLALPPGSQMVQRAQHRMQSDYLAYNEEFKRTVCMTFGVPLTLFQDSQRLQAGADQHQQTFAVNCKRIAEQLSDTITELYNTVYARQLYPEVMRLAFGEEWMATPDEQQRTSYLDNKVRLVLMHTPKATAQPEQLWQAFTQRVISPEELITHMRQAMGLGELADDEVDRLVARSTGTDADPWNRILERKRRLEQAVAEQGGAAAAAAATGQPAAKQKKKKSADASDAKKQKSA